LLSKAWLLAKTRLAESRLLIESSTLG
jgi:hypothetical protein